MGNRYSERTLNSVINQVPDIIYRLDKEGSITFINKAVEKYGYTKQELIGTPIIEWIHPEDRQKASYRVNERRAGERHTKSLEVRLVKKKTGRGFDEATTDVLREEPVFLITAQGMYGSGSVQTENFIGAQGIARDISESKLDADRTGDGNFLGRFCSTSGMGCLCHRNPDYKKEFYG